jgi:hypothetical protein
VKPRMAGAHLTIRTLFTQFFVIKEFVYHVFV